MPERTPRTKAEKQAAVQTVMHEYKHGKLHSGSKSGPKVKSRKQAIAIAMSESNQAKKGVDRSSHNKGNPGFPSSASSSPPKEHVMKSKKTEAAHEAREKQVMGAGYKEHEKGFGNKGHESPQSMANSVFNHKQLKGCFLAEHHQAVDVSRTPHRFRGTQGTGLLRHSGVAGAHRIGKR